MTTAILIGLGIAGLTFLASRYFNLLDHREERDFRRWHELEQRKTLRAADVATIAEKAADVEKALIVHEERLSQVELTIAGGQVRRRP